jgi:hypothetical protein
MDEKPVEPCLLWSGLQPGVYRYKKRFANGKTSDPKKYHRDLTIPNKVHTERGLKPAATG